MTGEATTHRPLPLAAAVKPRIGIFRQLRVRAFTRMGWGLADQAVSSLTNVAVSFYLVHTLTPKEFGAFSLAYVTYGFALNSSRGLATDPLMVRYSGVEAKRWRRAVGGATGMAIAVGLVAGSLSMIAAVITGGVTGVAFLALGLTLPGLMLQDAWRFSFFAHGRGGHAFLNDLIWALLLVPALVILHVTGHATVFWVLLAWGASAGVAALVGPFQARVWPRVSDIWFWLYLHRDLGPRYLAEGTVSNSGVQIRSYGMGFMLGLSALGYLQASTTLFGPTTILFSAMGLVAIPEASRVLRRSPSKLGLFCLVLAAGLGIVGLAWGVVLLVALPRGLGNLILGPIWRPTYPLILPVTIGTIGSAVGSSAGAGLHALGASRKSLRVTILAMLTYAGFSLIGAALGGAAGAVWGTALSAWTSSSVFLWQLYVAMREARVHKPADRSGMARPLPPGKLPPGNLPPGNLATGNMADQARQGRHRR